VSEFSCSYHLKSDSIDDCVSLIRKAKVTGFVFPAREGWVSFVVNEPDFVFSKKLMDANDGVLLNFINAEDHGWSFEIFNKNTRICKFECSYSEDEDEDDFDELNESSFDDIDDFARYFPCIYSHEKCVENWDGLFSQDQSCILDRVFSMDRKTPPSEKVTVDDFASGMGLYFYEWVSYDYISSDPPEEYGEYTDLKITEV
jgi:hypothetical protein